MKVVLTVEQANQLISYLGTKPYAEVLDLINMLQSCVIKDEKDKDGTSD